MAAITASLTNATKYFKKASLLFLMFTAFHMDAQETSKIDSLLSVYQNSRIDTVKLKALYKITSHFLYRDIKQAKTFAKKEMQLAQKLNDVKAESYASHHYAIIYNNLNNYDSSKYYHNNTIKLSEITKDLQQQSFSTHGLVILEQAMGNLENAERLNERNLELNKKRQDTFGIALSYDVKASIYMSRGHNLLALKSVLKSLELFEYLEDKVRMADSNNKLAVIENSLGNYKSSLNYSSKALDVYKETEDIDYQSQILNIRGISYKSLDENEQAIELFNQSLAISTNAGYKSTELVSLSHLTDIYLDKNNLKHAKTTIDRGLKLANNIGYKAMQSYLNFRLANYYSITGKYNRSLQILNNEIVQNKSNEDLSYRSKLHKQRSELYKSMRDFNNALNDFETHKKLNDSVFNKEKASKIDELRIIHDTEEKQKEILLQQQNIELLEQKEQVLKTRQFLLGLGIISLLVVGGLISYAIKQKMKRNRTEREKIDSSLQFKEKELTTHALHLAHKNEVLLDLKSQLKELKSSGPNSRSYQNVINTINLDINNDNNWEQFRSYFEEVHRDFNAKVMRNYPEVSNNDLRLMSLLKMNLSSKEIANILNISIEGVKKARYRLRKKLNLTTEDSLQELVIDL